MDPGRVGSGQSQVRMKHRKWLIGSGVALLLLGATLWIALAPPANDSFEPEWMRTVKPESWGYTIFVYPFSPGKIQPDVSHWSVKEPRLSREEMARRLEQRCTPANGWKMDHMGDGDFKQWRKADGDTTYYLGVGVHKGGRPYVSSQIQRPLTWSERASRSVRRMLGLPVKDHDSKPTK